MLMSLRLMATLPSCFSTMPASRQTVPARRRYQRAGRRFKPRSTKVGRHSGLSASSSVRPGRRRNRVAIATSASRRASATLLRRLPGLTLDDADNPEWRPTFVLRGLKRLPALW